MDGEELNLNSAIPFAGRYILKRLLGSGGMGSVYLASDSMLVNEHVAIKVLHAELCKNEKHTQRFLREVQLTRRVTHPNVVRTFDVGNENGRLFFTMEYAQGTTLKEKLLQGPLDSLEAAAIIREVCKGLFAIHQADIIHRDLKPGNIILTPEGFVKITDFGVAKPGVSDLTGHNEIIGSIPYMAPEVWVGRGVDAQADIYALGVVAYEMVTGLLPFEGDSPAELMCKHLEQRPVPPQELCETVPAWLDSMIMQMLEKDARRRPAGAGAVVSAINEQLDGQGSSAKQEEDDLVVRPAEPEPYRPTVLHGFTDAPASLDDKPGPQLDDLEVFQTAHKRHEYIPMPERDLEPDGYDYADLSIPHRVIRHTAVFSTALALCALYLWRFESHMTPWAQGLWTVTMQMKSLKGAVWALAVSFAVYAPLFAMPIFLLAASRRNLVTALHVWLGATVLTLFSITGVFLIYWSNLELGAPRLQQPLEVERILSSAHAALVYSAELSLLIPQGTVFGVTAQTKSAILEPVMQPALSQHVMYWLSLAFYFVLLARFIEQKVVLRARRSWRFKAACAVGCGIVPVALQVALLYWLAMLQELYATRDLRLAAGPINHFFDHYSVYCAVLNWGMLVIGATWIIPALVKKFRRE